MRKVIWGCVAVGCCALGAAAYVWQNPDSSLGQWTMRAGQSSGAHAGTEDADAAIPPDPAPIEEPSDPPAVPVLPGSSKELPPAVAALIPPIIIHDEEDLNASSSPAAKPEPPPVSAKVDREPTRPATYDIEGIGARIDGDVQVEPTAGPPMMPRCTDEAPTMPRCSDDDPLGRVMHRPAAWAWWLGFFAGPSNLTMEPALPGAEEDSEPPAPKTASHVDPLDLFGHSRHMPMPRSAEPESDTMEMRPSDWKPYSLDPGPF